MLPPVAVKERLAQPPRRSPLLEAVVKVEAATRQLLEACNNLHCVVELLPDAELLGRGAREPNEATMTHTTP